MHLTLNPDDFIESFQPLACQALYLVNGAAGLSGDCIDEEVELGGGSGHMVTAVVALLDMVYERVDEPPRSSDLALAAYLREVAALLDANGHGEQSPSQR